MRWGDICNIGFTFSQHVAAHTIFVKPHRAHLAPDTVKHKICLAVCRILHGIAHLFPMRKAQELVKQHKQVFIPGTDYYIIRTALDAARFM